MTALSETIPLNKLIPWSGNVRKTDASTGIEELAASIASHGLLNPLLVRKDKRGKYAVIAGQRRLLALQSLVAIERIDADCGIECRIAGDGASASELSLAENVVRVAMHPADEFEAFRDLVDQGASIDDIAARFGVAEARVEKRLRLGRLSPVILAAYRAGDIGLEEAIAFTLGSDHSTQERVLADLPPWQCKPSSIRKALTAGEIPASDPRVQLVGLDAYQQAGGAVRRDLFDDENAGYVQDAVLLDSLTMKRLHEAAVPVKAEGWSWVECAIDLDWNALAAFRRAYPQQGEVDDAALAELGTLQGEYDALSDVLEADEEDAKAAERQFAISERMDAIRQAAEIWPSEKLAIAGAIVTVNGDGRIEIKRGLIRPADAKAHRKAEKPERASDADGQKPLPATLIAELSAQRTAALAATLMKRPDAALAATVHALALDVFYSSKAASCLRLRLTQPMLGKALFDAQACKALSALETETARWRKRLPKDAGKLFAWCLEQKRTVLFDLLAVIAAHSVDAVVSKTQPQTEAQLGHAEALGKAIDLDLASWYRPDASGYFERIGKPAILSAIEEATGKKAAPAWSKMTRAELAKKAAKLIAPTKWLPAPLRSACDNASKSAPAAMAAE